MHNLITIGWLIMTAITARVMYHRWKPGTTQAQRVGKAVLCAYICLIAWWMVAIILLVMTRKKEEEE